MNLADELMQTSLGQLLNTEDASHLVEKAKHKSVPSGSVLFEAGAKGDALYVVLSGTLEVILGKPGANATVVATVGGGQVVGELEVMTKTLRVATLVATTDTEVLELSESDLEAMLQVNHGAASKVMTYIAKTLARRLAAVNQRIVAKSPRPATAPPPVPAAAAESEEPMEIDEADVVPIDDDDLDVLDKLWG